MHQGQHIAAAIDINIYLDGIRAFKIVASLVLIENGQAKIKPLTVAAQFRRKNIQVREKDVLALGVKRAFIAVDLPAIAAFPRLDGPIAAVVGGQRFSRIAIKDELLIDRIARSDGMLHRRHNAAGRAGR